MVGLVATTGNATMTISGAIAVFVLASLVCVEASRWILRKVYQDRHCSNLVKRWAFGPWVHVFRKRALIIGALALGVALASWIAH